MADHAWALPQLAEILPLDQQSLEEILVYTDTLSNKEAAGHLGTLLGDSPQSLEFITSYISHRSNMPGSDIKKNGMSEKTRPVDTHNHATSNGNQNGSAFAPPSYPPPTATASRALRRPHTNPVIEAGQVRARDEQEMQNRLQNLQFQYQIYNSEIDPEHETEYYCNCPIHAYQRMKWQRVPVQDMWSKAVMYPGEKAYTDVYRSTGMGLYTNNPYRFRVVSPYGQFQTSSYYGGMARPKPGSHAASIHQTIDLNNRLNHEAQLSIDKKEPKVDIWTDAEEQMNETMAQLSLAKSKGDRRPSAVPSDSQASGSRADVKLPPSRFDSIRKSIGMKTSEEKAVSKTAKAIDRGSDLKQMILAEEAGRWPDEQWRKIVADYQDKVGMTFKIDDLRRRQPIQYLHLLRAGYFEPIPVAWAGQASNPLKFSIEAASGWRGITPAWRGYEDTAEERLYWVLNHRDGAPGNRMKPDFISAMDMARARMASAVPPPPEYFSPNDTCNVQHTSSGYSNQVMPPPFRPFDRPETPTDDTMILLDVSGSMDFEPARPVYNQYLITGYTRSTQPKNKDVAKAIIRRFTDAMSNHDHQFTGYDLVTFSSQAHHAGIINHQNLDQVWRSIHLGGGTRVMTGWQMVKERHFARHSASATHHPIYGWQAGPETPMLRLLLLLDGEATDMDEFELDLLGLSWAHVTIFLIGVDGCPHHHRHANELQRISDVNHHVSFVDAQGNTPERFVTHELLKRHLGYAMTMEEFTQLEELPAYSEIA